MIGDAFSVLSFDRALEVIEPAVVFALVLAMYTMIVFYFCRFIARRDLFRFQHVALNNLVAHNAILRVLLFSSIWIFRYCLIFPLLAYGWFFMLTVMLAILYNSKEPAHLIIISMSVITAVRVTAYFEEDLARDIARILPFALLGLFVANLADIDIEATSQLLRESGNEWERLLYYWVYVILQEIVLRLLVPAFRAVRDLKIAHTQWRRTRAQQQTRTVTARQAADEGGDEE